MKQRFTKIFILLLTLFGAVFCQQTNGNGKEYSEDVLRSNDKINSSENRLPDLLKEAKVLLSDAFISDVMNDTLEVVYNLNRIRAGRAVELVASPQRTLAVTFRI